MMPNWARTGAESPATNEPRAKAPRRAKPELLRRPDFAIMGLSLEYESSKTDAERKIKLDHRLAHSWLAWAALICWAIKSAKGTLSFRASAKLAISVRRRTVLS